MDMEIGGSQEYESVVAHTAAEMQAALKSTNVSANPSDSLVSKCLALCTKYSMDPPALARHVEAFMINNSVDDVTLDLLGRYEQELASSHKQQQETKFGTPSRDAASSLGKRPFSSGGSQPFASPQDHIARIPQRTGDALSPESFQLTPTPTVSYVNRENVGQVVGGHNMALGQRGEFERSSRPSGARCVVSTDQFNNVAERYRFMFVLLEQKAAVLEKQLIALQTQICENFNVPELAPVGIPMQESVVVAGRIACEAAQGRITKTAVVLEGSRRESGGRRVLLDLSELKSYALFPGQIVLVQGINSSGRKLVAQRIYDGIPRPLSVSSPAQLREYHHRPVYQNGKPLSIWMASGPFTTSDNLEYAPLNDLLYNVAESRPDVLVLVGPFVDISHPSLQDGRVYLSVEDDDGTSQQPANYEAVFVQKIVRDGLEALFNTVPDLPTQIILVPSLLDAHHEFVFPQPPFADREPVKNAFFEADLGALHIPQTTGPHPRVHCLSNPCMFSVNDVVFGVTSNDVLLQLSAEEISAGAPGNRLARLAAHMLNQQSFNPVFPPPANGLAQMDLKQHKHWSMPVTPDVLLMPSKLAQFARDVQGCLVVNPGQLSKVTTGGTFARMSVHPIPEEDLLGFEQQNQEIPHQLVNRSSVEIVRI